MIIVNSHKQKDYWTDNIKHIEKYRVNKKVTLKNGTELYNGTVLAERPEKGSYQYQHGFTIASCQGMTMESKLYIDISKHMSAKLLYTALSRAKRLDQIYLVKSPKINTNNALQVL